MLYKELLEHLEEELEKLKDKKLHRSLKTISSPQGPTVILNGREVILMCSNNYLGLANHPRVIRAAQKAMEELGYGAVASRLVSGNMSIHEKFEAKVAEFKGTERALLFNCGYMANMGVISTVCDSAEDLVISDRLNHASIIDGIMLSKAKFATFRHNDLEHLEKILKDKRARRKLIVVDGVFSMDGDIAPVRDIMELAERYGATVMVDDAHATGVIGETGRGSAEYWNTKIHIQMGTLGKALGGFGAFVCADKIFIDFLINRCRPFIYTTALPVPVVAAALEALKILEEEPERVKRLRENVRKFVKGLEEIGFDVKDQGTAIVPIIIGDEDKCLKFSQRLLELGVFAAAIRPPTVPKGTSRIRVTLMATHTQEHIERAIEAFKKAAESVL